MTIYEVWKELPATEDDDAAEFLVGEFASYAAAETQRDLLIDYGLRAWIEIDEEAK